MTMTRQTLETTDISNLTEANLERMLEGKPYVQTVQVHYSRLPGLSVRWWVDLVTHETKRSPLHRSSLGGHNSKAEAVAQQAVVAPLLDR